MANCWHWWH